MRAAVFIPTSRLLRVFTYLLTAELNSQRNDCVVCGQLAMRIQHRKNEGWLLALIALIAAGSLLLGMTASAAPEAQAAAVRECGSFRYNFRNITTRSVSCWEAKKVVAGWVSSSSRPTRYVRGFTCKTLATGLDFADVRCTAGEGRVVRWQVQA